MDRFLLHACMNEGRLLGVHARHLHLFTCLYNRADWHNKQSHTWQKRKQQLSEVPYIYPFLIEKIFFLYPSVASHPSRCKLYHISLQVHKGFDSLLYLYLFVDCQNLLYGSAFRRLTLVVTNKESKGKKTFVVEKPVQTPLLCPVGFQSWCPPLVP